MPESPNVTYIESDLGDDLTSSENRAFPVYPSCFIKVDDNKYNAVAKDLTDNIKVPCIFFDGEVIIVPESYVELIEYIENTYNGEVIARDQMKKHEFATLAIAKGVNGNLVLLGDCLVGLDGTAQQMLDKALSQPEATKLAWRELYLQSMKRH
tara:strand:- start:683 stop:1141 length:459 start_codon:yes stop_codon:yes gene_type:complete